jgi:hypothetical protein
MHVSVAHLAADEAGAIWKVPNIGLTSSIYPQEALRLSRPVCFSTSSDKPFALQENHELQRSAALWTQSVARERIPFLSWKHC